MFSQLPEFNYMRGKSATTFPTGLPTGLLATSIFYASGLVFGRTLYLLVELKVEQLMARECSWSNRACATGGLKLRTYDLSRPLLLSTRTAAHENTSLSVTPADTDVASPLPTV